MIREIAPRRLLDQAERLARGTGGRGQPRNIDLRRAVSDAYYAVFHGFTLAIVESLVPASAREDQLRLVRSVEHGSVATVCRAVVGTDAFRGSAPHRPIADGLRSDAEIVHVCQSFVALQQQRYQADYDHLADFSRPDTLASVARAQRTVELLENGQHRPRTNAVPPDRDADQTREVSRRRRRRARSNILGSVFSLARV